MNIAVIFAGGSGRRMHTKDKPKPSATPSELEGAADLPDSIDIARLHEEYEAARYK